MSSAVSVSVIIAISSGAGVIVLASTAIVVFLAIHRKRQNRAAITKHVADAIALDREPIETRSSCDWTASPRSKRGWRPLLKAFSERNLKRFKDDDIDEPPRVRNVLQRKRYGGVPASSLPVFSIVAPRIPSPTLSLGKQSILFEGGESYMLSPIANSNAVAAGGSRTLPTDQWPLPPCRPSAVQGDPLRPQPLFHGHSRSLSGHLIPSAHPPRKSSTKRTHTLVPPPARSEEHPGLKRFMSLQQIGQAPTGALPTPPGGFGRLSSLRESSSRITRSRSPRSRSMESLISGTSSILRSSSSLVAGRKRSATEAYRATPVLVAADEEPSSVTDHCNTIESRDAAFKAGRLLASRPSLRARFSNGGSGDDSMLPWNKSSALSMTLMDARTPHANKSTSSRTSSNASRPSALGNKRRTSPSRSDAPAVQSPSPKRYVRGYRLLQDTELANAPALPKASDNWPLPTPASQELDASNDPGHSKGLRRVKPFISYLPRSPRPEDRPVGFYLTPRSQASSGRGSPIERVLPPGAEQGKLASSNSQTLLQPPTTPPVHRKRSPTSDPVTAPQPVEPVTCGDLASFLRRTDSLCDADDGAGYFNLTGGTCIGPREVDGAWDDPASHRSSAVDGFSPDPPLYGRSARTSGFYTPGSIAAEPSLTQSPPLSVDQEPGLTPNTSSSPHSDPGWLRLSSRRSVGELGLGFAGRFDITSSGMSFSPASSPAPSPCPSPPPRSELRKSVLLGPDNVQPRDTMLEPPTGVQKLDGGRAREFCVVGSEEAPAVRRPGEDWGFWETRAAHDAETHSAEMSRDMQLAAQRSRVVVRERGYPIERRDRRSLFPRTQREMPGMAF